MFLQIVKFGLVGVVATVVDFGVLVVLKELLGVDVLIASAISFCVSVAVNYVLSMAFVFKSKERNKLREILIFVLLSVTAFPMLVSSLYPATAAPLSSTL